MGLQEETGASLSEGEGGVNGLASPETGNLKLIGEKEILYERPESS
jgi:hypothetical protein